MTTPLTRRAAITGALISSAALAVPAVASVNKMTKAEELRHFLDTAAPDDLVRYHAAKLAEALCRARAGLWRYTLSQVHNPDQIGVVLFHRRDSDVPGVSQDFL